MLTTRFDEALVFASDLHRTQRRKGSGVPYISHLLQVAGITLEYGGDEDTAIAALLHDALEDQGGPETRTVIAERFGEHVARIVEGCSDSVRDGPKRPWRERKERHLARIPHESPEVRLVMAADKLHNIRSVIADYRRLGERLWAVFTAGREGTLWYYRAMTHALVTADPDALISRELQAAIADLERCVAGDFGA